MSDNSLRGGSFVNTNRWFGLIVSLVLLLSIVNPIGAFAKGERMLQDESIYDLLVDRFNNGNLDNDENVSTKDMHAFSGGDFAGIISKLDYLKEMNFTMISLGPVFSTALYDGNEVLDYEKLEPHFGTEQELADLIDAAHSEDIGVIADFPLNGISEQHVWVENDALPLVQTNDGSVHWDYTDVTVKEKLKAAVVSFIEQYDLDGIRLTKLGDFEEAFLNEVIEAVKEEKPMIYVFSNEPSTANFDSVPNLDKMEALRQSYVQFEPDSSPLDLFTDKVETDFIQFDELIGPRFTYDIVELRMFPPTRWKIATTALFTLPGVPVVPYGTEIAVNGKEAPESHPNSNFFTDMELQEYISDLNFLRNKSDALRNGEFELLHNKDGFTVYKRSSEEETWIIALNNTSVTSNLEISQDLIGDNKRLRGVLDGDMVRQSKDGAYRIVLEREVAEVYIADEDTGFNIPYLIASILVYVLFLTFLFVIWRRGKRIKQEN